MIERLGLLHSRKVGGVGFVITAFGVLLFFVFFITALHLNVRGALPPWLRHGMDAAGIGLSIGFFISVVALFLDKRRGVAVVSILLALTVLFFMGEVIFKSNDRGFLVGFVGGTW